MSKATLEYLALSLWAEKSLSDVTIQFQDNNFAVHKLMLFQSPYWRRLFKHADQTELLVETEDPNVTSKALEACLASLYGINPEIKVEEVFSLLSTAHLVELEDLCVTCINFMQENITDETFRQWHSINLAWDGGACQQKVQRILHIFLERTAFKETRGILHSLPNEDLFKVLTSNNLWVPSEVHRFYLITDVYESRIESLGENPPLTLSMASTECSETDSKPSPVESEERSNDYSEISYCNSSDASFFEHLLAPMTIYYHNFPFPELSKARKKAHDLRFRSTEDYILQSLWSKNALEQIITNEALKTKESVPVISIEESSLLDFDSSMVESLNFKDQLSTLRFSTEVENVSCFDDLTQFESEQVYYAGSLFRVVLSPLFDEMTNKTNIGAYLQRTIISSPKSCTFCDPRSRIDVNLEFIAGSRNVEAIELDGHLEPPCCNQGYSKFLFFSELDKYLSPVETLRVTVILKMKLPILTSDEK